MSTKPTINLDDSKSELWQWDTGRYLSLPDTDAKEVHISRGGMRSAHVVKIQEQKAVIPDDLLVLGGRLFVYIVQQNATGEMTIYDKWFDIRRRPKPDDYIYTEQEIKRWEALEKRITEAEKVDNELYKRIDKLEKEGATADHTKLTNRDAADQHPIGAITGLTAALDNNSKAASEAMEAAQEAGNAAGAAQKTADNATSAASKAQETANSATTVATELDKRLGAAEKELEGKQPVGDYITEESDPTVPEWAKQPKKPTYTATEVGALPEDTQIPSKVSELENDAQYAKTSELPKIDATLTKAEQAADAAETGNRIEAISPDDSAIDGKPWSSKQIIDTLCPPLEESGNPVVCYPVAGYPLGVKASWEPMQEGSGTPSPENIRPIKGRGSVTVERCGENLIKYPTISKRQGIELSVDDNKLTIKGTCSIPVEISSDNIYLPDDTYTLSSDVLISKGAYISAFTNIEKLLLNHKVRKRTGKISGNTHMFIYLEAGTYNFTVQVSLVSGTTAPTTYKPYIGQTNTLTLTETVYGGEVDAVTGDGKRTWGIIDNYAGETIPREWISDRDVYSADKNPTVGAQVAYRLAEPVPFTATGAQPIPALSGTNTLLTDADSITVTGRENNSKYTPQWYQVADITLTEPVQRVSIDKDAEGNLIADYAPIIEIIRVEYAADSTQASQDGNPWIYPFPTTDANNGRFLRTIYNWKNLTRRESYLYTGKGKCIWGQSGAETVIGTNETSTITGALVMLNNAVSDTEPYDHLSVGTNVKVLVYGVKP